MEDLDKCMKTADEFRDMIIAFADVIKGKDPFTALGALGTTMAGIALFVNPNVKREKFLKAVGTNFDKVVELAELLKKEYPDLDAVIRAAGGSDAVQ